MLNPLNPADPAVMNDVDLAGPLVFCLLFGGMLLLVSYCCHGNSHYTIVVREGSFWIHIWYGPTGLCVHLHCS